MSESRIRAIAILVFERGGIAGAVRRIVFGWHGRFSAVQISIAITRRWPLLVPSKYQVADCIEWMEKCRQIKCIMHKPTKLYEATRLQFQMPVRVGSGDRRKDLNHPFVYKNRTPVKGDRLKLFTGMRTKNYRKLKEVICQDCCPIQITEKDIILGKSYLPPGAQNLLAVNDGFQSASHMRVFFIQTYGLPLPGKPHRVSWKSL